MSLFMLSRTAFVTSTVDDDHRGRIMSTLGLIRRLMALFAPIVAGFIAEYTMARNVFFVQAALCVVYGLWAAHFIPLGAGMNSAVHRRGSLGSVQEDTGDSHEYSSVRGDGDAVIGDDAHDNTISHALITNDGQIHTSETAYSHPGAKRVRCTGCGHVGSFFGPLTRQVKKYALTIGLYWKHLLLVGTYCQVMNTVRQSRLLLIPLQATGMGLSDLTVSVIVGIGWGMDALFAPVSGFMMDRYGRVFCGCLTGLVMAVSFFILAGVSVMYPPEGESLDPMAGLNGTDISGEDAYNATVSGMEDSMSSSGSTSTEAVAAILFASIAMGIANGASGGLILTLSSDIAQLHPTRRGEFLALFMVIVDTGFIFGPYVAGAVANTFGIAWSSVAVGILAIASSVWMLLLIPETKGMGARYQQFLEDRANESDLMRDTPVGTEYDDVEVDKSQGSRMQVPNP